MILMLMMRLIRVSTVENLKQVWMSGKSQIVSIHPTHEFEITSWQVHSVEFQEG